MVSRDFEAFAGGFLQSLNKNLEISIQREADAAAREQAFEDFKREAEFTANQKAKQKRIDEEAKNREMEEQFNIIAKQFSPEVAELAKAVGPANAINQFNRIEAAKNQKKEAVELELAIARNQIKMAGATGDLTPDQTALAEEFFTTENPEFASFKERAGGDLTGIAEEAIPQQRIPRKFDPEDANDRAAVIAFSDSIKSQVSVNRKIRDINLKKESDIRIALEKEQMERNQLANELSFIYESDTTNAPQIPRELLTSGVFTKKFIETEIDDIRRLNQRKEENPTKFVQDITNDAKFLVSVGILGEGEAENLVSSNPLKVDRLYKDYTSAAENLKKLSLDEVRNRREAEEDKHDQLVRSIGTDDKKFRTPEDKEKAIEKENLRFKREMKGIIEAESFAVMAKAPRTVAYRQTMSLLPSLKNINDFNERIKKFKASPIWYTSLSEYERSLLEAEFSKRRAALSGGAK